MLASMRRNWLTWTMAGALIALFLIESYQVGWRNLTVGGGLVDLPLSRSWGVFPPAVRAGEWWRLIAAGFVHADVIHIGANLLGLLYAGTFVEDRFGRTRWLVIYITALIAGNVLALVTSNDRTVTIGASGAIMGLFGGFAAFGARYWSQRDELSRGAGPIIATLANGFLRANVSNAAHVGGVVIGLVVAHALGPLPTLAQSLSEAEDRLAAKSDAEAPPVPRFSAAFVSDPHNQLMLRRGRWAQAAFALLAVVSIVGALFVITTVPWLTVVLLVVGIFAVLATRQRLVLTPVGVRFVGAIGRAREIDWRDVERFVPMQIGGNTTVGLVYRPSYLARRERESKLRQLVLGGRMQNLGSGFGMSIDAEIELLESWRVRWTQDDAS